VKFQERGRLRSVGEPPAVGRDFIFGKTGKRMPSGKRRKKRMKRGRVSSIWFLVILLLTGISLACESSTPANRSPTIGSAASGSVNGQSTRSNPTGLTITAASLQTEAYLGDAVQKDGYVLTALRVSDPAEPGLLSHPEAGKKFITVEVLIGNLSGRTLAINPLSAAIEDSAGYSYPAVLGGIVDQLRPADLDQGEQVRGIIGFTIPDDSRPASVKYSMNSMPYDYLQAGLLPPPSGHTPITVTITPKIPSSKMGEVVERFGYSITVLDVEDPSTPEVSSPIPNGFKLVACEVMLENVSGSEALSVNLLSAFLVDADGFVYSADYDGRDGQIRVAHLQIGEKANGWVSFTIPKDSSPLYFKYQTDIFAGNYLIAGLM
jgi:hypothetical protein